MKTSQIDAIHKNSQFKADAILPLLAKWCKIPSFTRDLQGLERMRTELEKNFKNYGKLEVLALNPISLLDNEGYPEKTELGKALRIRKPGKTSVFLGIHYDTVHPNLLPVKHDKNKNTLSGAGAIDAKGGIAVLLVALQTVRELLQTDDLGWEILLNPDEEIGSPGSLPLIQEAAQRNKWGLIFEPALPGGKLASSRLGSANFEFVFVGKTAHAGRNLHQGKNAVIALSKFVIELQKWSVLNHGILVNPGVIRGGQAMNVVPARAIIGCNIRVPESEMISEVEKVLGDIQKKIQKSDGVKIERYGGFLSRLKSGTLPPEN